MFHEKGVFNYSTMLLREDLALLMLGAREAVYALDLNDISKKLASVRTPRVYNAAWASSILEQCPSAFEICYQRFLGRGQQVGFFSRTRTNFRIVPDSLP